MEQRRWLRCAGLVSGLFSVESGGKQGRACCSWLLAAGWEAQLPQRKADGDQASENNSDSTSLAPECMLSGNSRPVGIWDTSLVVFCREKNHTLLLGSMKKKKKAGFSSHLEVFLFATPTNLKKGNISQHVLDLGVRLFGV